MREILKTKGLKATPARLAVLEIFAKSNAPIPVEKIYLEISRSKKYRNINEATIYRTLSTFLAQGIVTKVNLGKDASFFELSKEHHHHITCLKCYGIEDFENKEIEKTLGRISRNSSKFNLINNHSLELFGLCKECA